MTVNEYGHSLKACEASRYDEKKRENFIKRKEMTKFLSDLLVQERLSGTGKYYAREVTLDYGTKNARRVDYMQFVPEETISISQIEKGYFISYEVKSCKEDFYSGFGKNFETEKNYLVMPISVLKEVEKDIPYGIGVICPIPQFRDSDLELAHPTPLNTKDIDWNLRVVKPARMRERTRSMTELLFCMLRSGK